nr:topless-related protein 4-like isoform X1 [Ipomoea batatas]GMD59089.1 topless-related protein 4-like isoform X1 [Ipomoea batatas]
MEEALELVGANDTKESVAGVERLHLHRHRTPASGHHHRTPVIANLRSLNLPKAVVMTLNPGSAVKSMDFHPVQQILLLVALQKQIRIWDNVNEIIKGTVVVLIVKVTKDGYHAIGLVLSASEEWGVVNSGGECIWSLHPMCNRLSGDIYFSSCDFGAMPISNMEDKDGYHSI